MSARVDGQGPLINALLQTTCPHGVACADHDACCQQNPHKEGHVHCAWCGHCRSCHPAMQGGEHDCYHHGEPCSRCGTSVKDRPLPIFRDHRGMCRPPVDVTAASEP